MTKSKEKVEDGEKREMNKMIENKYRISFSLQ